jgi:hypothetical protein
MLPAVALLMLPAVAKSRAGFAYHARPEMDPANMNPQDSIMHQRFRWALDGQKP